MSSDIPFRDLIRRVRAGDARACTELVRRYEPAIRVAVHVRLTDPALRRVLDTMDVCQSVLANFFARAALGQFELDSPAQLVRLLQTMAYHRLINHVRQQQADVRDARRVVPASDDGQIADHRPGPSEVVANRELLREFRKRLSPEARHLADQRARGRSWKDIADELGTTAGAVRLRFSRECDQVASELRLGE
jgi:RNA polymerase sigma-70 factor (ECF subfamily)